MADSAAYAPPAQPAAPGMANQQPMAPPGEAAGDGFAAPDSAPSIAGADQARNAKQAPGEDDKKLNGDHMLIFTGTLNMEVDRGDIATSIDKVVDQAAKLGGYVSKQDDTSVTVRVPSESFRRMMQGIEAIGEVTHRGVQAQDVTEEFNDIGVRLKSLRATRARLENFLERAKTIEEVLRVEQELARLNGDIDRLEGRLQFLAERSSMSTITVALFAKPVQEKVVVEKAPPPPPPAKPVTRALPIEWLAKVGLDELMNLR